MRSRSDWSVGAILLALLIGGPVFATTYHVAKTGNDGNAGSTGSPFLTINKAAQILQPGDSVIVHAGEYREWVQPARGGSSASARIVYKAAPGESVEIKGSERVTTWASQGNGVWKVDLNDSFFGSYNPFSYDIRGRYPGEGDQYIAGGAWCHLGEVFLDGQIFLERQSLSEVQSTPKTWYTSRSGTTQSIYANFGTNNPNTQRAEINVRECVFGNPTVTSGIDYVTVDGFSLSQSSDEWCPPYRSSPLVSHAVIFPTGANWIIENCTIKYGKMRGICCDGGNSDKNHLIRNNVITECGIAGIAGCYANGSIFSGNWISDIHGSRAYWGDEHGNIKLNLSGKITVCGNILIRMISPGWAASIKLDWPLNPGWRISGNVCIEPTQYTLEIWNTQNNGVHMMDNNIFIGPTPSTNGESNEVFAHNLFYCGGGSISGPNNLVLNNQTNFYTIDEAAKTVTISFTAGSSVAGQNNPIVTTASLGTIGGTGRQATNPDGSSLSIDKDYYQICRPAGAAKSGPFQNLQAGLNTFVLRPNSNFDYRQPCTAYQPAFTSVQVSPAASYVKPGITLQLSAVAADQYSGPMNGASFVWSVSGGGTISSSGLFTAGSTLGGPHTVTVSGTVGGITKTGTATIMVSNQVPGLNYSYYEGTWSVLPSFASLTPVKTGTVPNFDISVATHTDNFAIRFSGYIQIPTAGQYTFSTSSDDGSRLLIDGQQAVDNDGAHGPQQRSGTVTLTAGMHAIVVDFFEIAGGELLTVSWAGPGVTSGPIPSDALFATNEATVLRAVPEIAGVPAMRVLTDALTVRGNGETIVRIVNAKGQVVRTGRIMDAGRLSLRDLAPGAYQVSILTSHGVQTMRIVR